MRREYQIIGDLFWHYRRSHPREKIALDALGITPQYLGEERLRRLVRFSLHIAGLLPSFHAALSAWRGHAGLCDAFEDTWTEMKMKIPGVDFVADTFHPSIIARGFRRFFARKTHGRKHDICEKVFQLEFARYRARLVTTGQSDPAQDSGLIPGASCIIADFDLPGVFNNLKRLASAQLPDETIRRTIKPVGKPTLVIVEVAGSEVVEYRLLLHSLPTSRPVQFMKKTCPDIAARICLTSTPASSIHNHNNFRLNELTIK